MSSSSNRFVKARRAYSMPSKFVLPSSQMGEYEEQKGVRKTSANGGLYPLREEGTYGIRPQAPLPFKPREKKPKVYSSYSVDNSCKIHAKKLANSESINGETRRRKYSVDPEILRAERLRKTSSNSLERKISAPEQPVMRKNSSSSYRYRSTSSSSNSRRKFSSSNYEDDFESEYTKLNDFGGDDYSDFTKDLDKKMSQISLDNLRKPEINSWDSMGILGLSNKIWHDTRKRQESFLQTTGHFLREQENTGSYIM